MSVCPSSKMKNKEKNCNIGPEIMAVLSRGVGKVELNKVIDLNGIPSLVIPGAENKS